MLVELQQIFCILPAPALSGGGGRSLWTGTIEGCQQRCSIAKEQYMQRETFWIGAVIVAIGIILIACILVSGDVL